MPVYREGVETSCVRNGRAFACVEFRPDGIKTVGWLAGEGPTGPQIVSIDQ